MYGTYFKTIIIILECIIWCFHTSLVCPPVCHAPLNVSKILNDRGVEKEPTVQSYPLISRSSVRPSRPSSDYPAKASSSPFKATWVLEAARSLTLVAFASSGQAIIYRGLMPSLVRANPGFTFSVSGRPPIPSLLAHSSTLLSAEP